jgi:hypothetical protein
VNFIWQTITGLTQKPELAKPYEDSRPYYQTIADFMFSSSDG